MTEQFPDNQLPNPYARNRAPDRYSDVTEEGTDSLIGENVTPHYFDQSAHDNQQESYYPDDL